MTNRCLYDLSLVRVNVEVGSARRVIDPVAPSVRSKYFKSLKEKTTVLRMIRARFLSRDLRGDVLKSALMVYCILILP